PVDDAHAPFAFVDDAHSSREHEVDGRGLLAGPKDDSARSHRAILRGAREALNSGGRKGPERRDRRREPILVAHRKLEPRFQRRAWWASNTSSSSIGVSRCPLFALPSPSPSLPQRAAPRSRRTAPSTRCSVAAPWSWGWTSTRPSITST